MMHKDWSGIEMVPYCFSRSSVKFQGHTGHKVNDFDPSLANRALPPIWIHKCPPKDAQSLKGNRRSALLFLKVIHQMSRSHETKISPIFTRIGRFRTITLVLNHKWLWNNAQSLKEQRRNIPLFFEIIYQISRSHDRKWPLWLRFLHFWMITLFWIHGWLSNGKRSFWGHGRSFPSFFEVPCQIARSHRPTNWRFYGLGSNLSKITGPIAAIKFLRFALFSLHCFRKWLNTEQVTSYYLNQRSPSLLRLYAAFGLDKLRIRAQIARFMGPTWAHLGPTGPRWAPCWPHERC